MSSYNKFNLLASLTSLPDQDDDNMLPPLAIDEDDSDNVGGGDNLIDQNKGTESMSIPVDLNNISSTENNNSTNNAGGPAGVGSLLSSSGLLTTLGGSTTADAMISGIGVGGGLFDQLEQEEERKAQEKAREEREREQTLLLERQRQEEELQRQQQQQQQQQRKEAEEKAKAAAEAAKVEKEKEQERERASIAAAAQAAAKAAVEESMVMSSSNVNHVVEGSVMGGMQELSLNGESTMSLGYRSDANHYSNLRQENFNGSIQHPKQMIHGENQSQQRQPAQYQSQQPPPIPQEQPQVVPTQHQPHQHQQIHQAGYGASSFYYSTTGNVQQIHHQQSTNQGSSTSTKPYNNNAMGQNLLPNNAMASSSYAERSNMMQNSHHQSSQPVHVTSQYQNQQQRQQMQHNNNQQQQPLPTMTQQYPTHIPQQHRNGQAMMHHQHQYQHLSNTNNTQHILNKPKIKPPPYNPNDFKPLFGPITVTDPILVQSPGVFSVPPHWIYNVIVRDVKKVEGQDEFSPIMSNVRRRFRHFVALEDRLRADCLGAILPPRPDKHPTRAIDEASARQSTQFALQRARELEIYLNGLRLHPLAGKSPTLHLFLTHPDHIGAAWPEVSSSIFTRLTEVGTSTAVKITEGTSAVMSELNNESQILAGEDNSELMALASSEGLRIGSVLQAVPRIEGTVAILGELAERMSVTGLEVQKLANNVLAHERELCKPFESLASGLLRSGRRTTRLAIEVGAASQVFTLQHKLCRYERMAFADRRSALVRRRDARLAADKRVQKLVVHQHSMQSMGHVGMMDGVSREAQMAEEIANDAFNEAEKIGQILQCEVGRIADIRKKDWSISLKVIAANMREAHAERMAIWESCRNSLLAAEQNPYETSSSHPVGGVIMNPETSAVQESMQATG